MTLTAPRRLQTAITGTVRALGRRPAVLYRLDLMALVDSVGSGLFLASSIVIFSRLVGISGAQIGIGLTVAGVISLAAALPTGLLTDRYGPRTVLISVSLWRGAGLVAYSWCHSITSFLVVTCLRALADRAAAPVLQALVSEVAGDARQVAAMARLQSVRNVGYTLGALLATIPLGIDSRPAYVGVLVADAASFVALALIVATLPRRRTEEAVGGAPADAASRAGPYGADAAAGRDPDPTGADPADAGPADALSDRPFLRVTLLNGVFSLHMSLLSVGLPTWVIEHTAAPRAALAPLLVVNTVMAVLLQVPTSRGAVGLAPSLRALRHAGVALALCCLVIGFSGTLPAAGAVPALVLAMVLLTVAELLQSAGGWGVSFALAPRRRQGLYLSVFGTGVTAQQVLGPGLLAAVVIPAAGLGWTVLAAVLLASAALPSTVLLRGRTESHPQSAASG